jgi:glycosyltransferase involved in cell wall biosynthesis
MEGFGLTNLEAMASGCVVVSTDTPGVRDYLCDGENGRMIPSNDAEALANTIRELLENPEDAKELAKEGRATAEAHDIAKTVAHEQTVLEGILASVIEK